MAELVVNADSKTAALQAGVTNGQLSEALHAERLGFPVGHSRTVGIGATSSEGASAGIPGVWGSACSNVTAIEVATADGTFIRADEHTYADLFWAACGSGPG